MRTETFKASTKYGDLKGSAAADDADQNSPRRWLESRGLLQKGELLLGISMSLAENYDKHEDPVYVTFLLTAAENVQQVLHVPRADEVPIGVRAVKKEMPLHEFMGLFKRFEVTLSPADGLEGKAYTSPDY